MKKVFLGLFIAGILLISLGVVIALYSSGGGYKSYADKMCAIDMDKEQCKEDFKQWKLNQVPESNEVSQDNEIPPGNKNSQGKEELNDPGYCSDSPCGPDRVYICHKNEKSEETLCIDDDAVEAHLKHGDYCGECIPPEPPADWEAYCKPEGVGQGFEERSFNGTIGMWCNSLFDSQFCDVFYGTWINDKLLMSWSEQWDIGAEEGWSNPNGYLDAWVKVRWIGQCPGDSGESWTYVVNWNGDYIITEEEKTTNPDNPIFAAPKPAGIITI